KRFAPEHGTGHLLHASMILLDNSIEILYLTEHNVRAVLLVVALDGGCIGLTAIDGHLLRHAMAAERGVTLAGMDRVAWLAFGERRREPCARLYVRGGSTWQTAVASRGEYSWVQWARAPASRRLPLLSCARRRRRPENLRTRRARSRLHRGTSVRTRPRSRTSIPMSSLSTRCSTAIGRGIRRSSGSGPGRSGPRGLPGAARGAIWSGATSQTIASCAGSKTTAV